MERTIIEEPQLTYLLELFTELGNAADDFILAGARAMRFAVHNARWTRDFDFVLNVIALRKMPQSIAEILEKLQYRVDPNARCFQFVKEIPNTQEKMRIEFLASEEEKRPKDFRVNVQQNVHARACVGAGIVSKESDCKTIKGSLPNGKPAEISLRVAHPHALVMLKLFAMDDRYKNIRGPKETRHDREEAQIHAGDVVSIVRYNIQKSDFKGSFWSQFGEEVDLSGMPDDSSIPSTLG